MQFWRADAVLLAIPTSVGSETVHLEELMLFLAISAVADAVEDDLND